jgi:hypothetical protein
MISVAAPLIRPVGIDFTESGLVFAAKTHKVVLKQEEKKPGAIFGRAYSRSRIRATAYRNSIMTAAVYIISQVPFLVCPHVEDRFFQEFFGN